MVTKDSNTDPKLGRKGFTDKKSIRTILESYEKPGRNPKVFTIDGLPADLAVDLLTNLPDAQLDYRPNDACPTFREMIEFGKEVPKCSLLGFRVAAGNPGERIAFNGFTVPQPVVDTEMMERITARGADARIEWVKVGGKVMLRVKW